MSAPRDPLEGRSQGPLGNLRRRIYLTYTHFGLRTLVFRALTLPLRFTPLERRMRLRTHARDQDLRRAREWYREHGRPVDVVIPSYRDATHVARLVRSIRKTGPPAAVRVIVADDCSGPEHLAALRAIGDIDLVVESERNGGFAANADHGIAASDPERDVVVLNSDVEALPGWLECLQYGAHAFEGGAGIVGAQLQYPDGRIQFGGTIRNRDQPQWFDHRYRFKPFDWGPAGVPSPALAVTGACMYLRRDALVRLGAFDETYPMAYEDVDLCLRAWLAGEHVLYFPSAQLVHHEAQTRGTDLGVRERESQRRFWELLVGLLRGPLRVDPRERVGPGPARRRATWRRDPARRRFVTVRRRRWPAADRLCDRGHRRRRWAPRRLRAPEPARLAAGTRSPCTRSGTRQSGSRCRRRFGASRTIARWETRWRSRRRSRSPPGG